MVSACARLCRWAGRVVSAVSHSSSSPVPCPHIIMASGEVLECETALTTLLALGTAKHRLTTSQQADLETEQAEVVAQRKTATQFKAEQDA